MESTERNCSYVELLNWPNEACGVDVTFHAESRASMPLLIQNEMELKWRESEMTKDVAFVVVHTIGTQQHDDDDNSLIV